MSPRVTVILALVAIGLGLFVYFYEIEGEVARKAAREEASLIHTGFTPEEISAVELTTLDGIEARFERQDGRWQVVSPVSAPADAAALDAICSALAQMPREGTVGSTLAEPEGAEAASERVDLSAFGLGSGAQVIRFEVGGQAKGLRVGGSTPVGGHRYVARIADDEVAYVASYRVNAFARNLADLRDRRIFTFESGDLATIRLRFPSREGMPASEIGLAKDEQGEWRLISPIEAPADEETVRDLLSDLAYLRASRFVDDPGDDVEAALAEPGVDFEWTLARGATGGATGEEAAAGPRRAKIGGLYGDGRVIRAANGRIYTIPADRIEDFPRSLVDYRFKRLADFELAAARRIEIGFADEDAGESVGIVALLEEAGWTSPGRPLDPDRMTRLVRTLSSLEADDIFAEEMGPAERASLGLSPARVTLNVEGGAQPGSAPDTLASLRFGRLDEDRGLFVMRADGPTIFLVNAEKARELPLDAEQYAEVFEVGSDDGKGEADDEVPPVEDLDDVERP